MIDNDDDEVERDDDDEGIGRFVWQDGDYEVLADTPNAQTQEIVESQVRRPNKKLPRLKLTYRDKLQTFQLGGPGSGNYGHAGRPGEVGGSASDGEGGGGGGGDSDDVSVESLVSKGSSDAITAPKQPDFGLEQPKPIVVKDVSKAVDLILKGKVVEVAEVGKVHSILGRLAKMARDAEKRGDKAPKYDLCKVTVSGSPNLFCGSKLTTKEFPKGVPRLKMPQFSGTAVEGSPASKLPKVNGEVNAASAFMDHLKGVGIKTASETVPAAHLKVTQAELVGPKVASIMTTKKYDPGSEPIFVSRDGYILDGHHRWAAVVGRDAADGRLGDSKMNIIRVDAPMSELYHRANLWTEEFGIQPKSGPSVQKLIRDFRLRVLAQIRGQSLQRV